MPMARNSSIETFCKKLFAAIILPVLFCGAKYWIIAFSGTINMPPKKPNANELRLTTPMLEPNAKNKSEKNIPIAPIGTIPSSMCSFDIEPATYEPNAMPMALTARIACTARELSSLKTAL